MRSERILIIRHGALGDFVLSLGACAAVRRHHRHAHIVLMTTAPYAELAKATGLFDEVWTDNRPKIWQLGAMARIQRQLRSGFKRIYDLQTSGRTGRYFLLTSGPKRPEWNGIAFGCSHPQRNPQRRRLHTVERQADQLAAAGILDAPFPNLDAVNPPIGHLDLAARFAILVPGGSAHRPRKRWPAERYAELAAILAEDGLTPVILGTSAETEAAAVIERAVPAALNLTGRTRIVELPPIARRAAVAIGNDTGPMHVMAIAGAPSVALFSDASDPVRNAPRAAPGRPAVRVATRPDLADLPVAEVVTSVHDLLREVGQTA